MIRTLLTTTALALLLSAPALAQNDAAQPADPNAVPAASDDMAPSSMDLLTKGYMASADDHLVSRLMGQPVYNSTADDAQQIGDINDLVLNPEGDVAAVVIGVGGFLGIGEKNVAVDYSSLQWTTAADNSQRLVLPTTKEELTAAAEFTWPDEQTAPASDVAATPAPAPAVNNDASAPAGQSAQNAAPSPSPAPADDNANAANDQAQVAATPAPAPAPADNAAPASPNAAADVAANANQDAANPNPVAQGMEAAQNTSANANATVPDYSAMQPVDAADLTTADQLIGTKVVGPENQQIAEVGDIVLTQDGKIDALLIDFGGFLGIGEKRVAVGMDNLRFVTDENGNKFVFINATKEQLDTAPAYDEASYAANREAQRLVVTN